MAQAPKKKGLGRGLSELMGDEGIPQEAVHSGRKPTQLEIDKLTPSPYQPRRVFDQESMGELINSVKEKGILQPLLVRLVNDDNYQIIAGERRWRAAQKAGLHFVPVVVREFSDSEALEIGIIENVQRQDLTAIEEAAGYKQLMEEFGHTQEQVSKLVGKSRSHVANLLRLMTLPDGVVKLIEDGKLSMGHARTLVGAENALTIAKMIVAKGLSVRASEKLAMGAKGKRVESAGSARKDTNTSALERDITNSLGLKVEINHGAGDAGGEGGTVIIRYKSLEQLDDLCGKLRS
jgi:ParB family chromosome partitioning protein